MQSPPRAVLVVTWVVGHTSQVTMSVRAVRDAIAPSLACCVSPVGEELNKARMWDQVQPISTWLW